MALKNHLFINLFPPKIIQEKKIREELERRLQEMQEKFKEFQEKNKNCEQSIQLMKEKFER